MQLTKPTFSLFAEDFELMKAKLSSDEIVDIFSALSDLCLWGECEYTPQTPKQEYFWEKLKTKFDYDLSSYKASVENGKKGAKYGVLGGRPKKTITPEETPVKTPTITPEETPSCHLSPVNNTLVTCDNTQSSDKPSDCVARKKLVPIDWFPKLETVDKLSAKGLDTEKVVERFINSCRAKNLKYVDFDRAILAWDWSKDTSVQKEKCWF